MEAWCRRGIGRVCVLYTCDMNGPLTASLKSNKGPFFDTYMSFLCPCLVVCVCVYRKGGREARNAATHL